MDSQRIVMEITGQHNRTQREQYVEVLLPLPLADCYTYRVPAQWVGVVQVGSRVFVPLGAQKRYTGVVRQILLDYTPPVGMVVKELIRVDDSQPVVLPGQLRLWQWMANYYMAPSGDVLKAALPSGLRDVDEEVAFKPKTQQFVELAVDLSGEETAEKMFAALSRSTKQMDLWLRFLHLSQVLEGEPLEVSRAHLLQGEEYSPAVLKALVQKGYLRMEERVVSRLTSYKRLCEPSKPLSPVQAKAYDDIQQAFKEKQTVLLWGVTSSGKTEIYIRLIEEALEAGKQVLYLVPEIALTTQLTERLQRVFGQKVGIYHSKFSNSERVEVWQKQLSDQPFPIILGVRSSVLLPFQRLGLVVVDEEHEQTYKQQDPSPRYHARNVALVLASYSGAKTLLGSATPSLESYFNAQEGKYGLVRLFTRYEDVQLPEVVVADVAQLRRKKLMKSPFAPVLIEQMTATLGRNEQVILFQNRRGYSSYVECLSCGWIPRCKVCDVSLTYHRHRPAFGQMAPIAPIHEHLSCHYCGAVHEKPQRCPQCGGDRIDSRGLGTERVEEEISALFPDYKVDRMDLDTTRAKNALAEMVERVQSRKSHILVGTQIVTKGLDFEHVSMVGILNADYLMNVPDFRAHERAFQLMAQVAGRAGRRSRQGLVVLQTTQPDHPLIQLLKENDIETFYSYQLQERCLFHYPPYTRLINIFMMHKDEPLLEIQSKLFAHEMQQIFGKRVLGPDVPPVGRVRSMHIRKLLLKVEADASMQNVKKHLLHLQKVLAAKDSNFKKLLFYFDVDPM